MILKKTLTITLRLLSLFIGLFFFSCASNRPITLYPAKQKGDLGVKKGLALPSPVAKSALGGEKRPITAPATLPTTLPSDNATSISTIKNNTALSELINQAKDNSTFSTEADAKVIGAILPLTGKNASIGQRALNAIRMGLGLNHADNKLRLALFDSQSNHEFAVAGADKLIKEDRAVVLLGGFTAREATSIATRAEQLKTPYIGFSQKSGLTSLGDYIFRNSVTPEMQVDKLVQFAVEKLSAKRFAILFPNDTYGVEFSNIFWDHVLARGGEVTAAQTYDPKETDFSATIQKLVGTYYLEARAEEYKKRVEEIRANEKLAQKKAPKKNTRDRWSEENILTPIINFDVLFVPDSSKALSQILAFMKYNDVKSMNYLGTNIWSSPDLSKRAASDSAKVYFVDAFDISEGSSQPVDFFKDYLTLYNEEPTLIEVQVYEAAKIIKDQLSAGADSRSSLAENLRSLGRRPGVTGELRMSSQREIERPMHVLTLDSGLVKKVE